MPRLVLGPLLRYAVGTEATIWVETDAPCEVEVLGHRARTFQVEGHHYALVIVRGVEPGRRHPYEVRLDGERRWPEEHSRFPPSAIHAKEADAPLEFVFGSCRVVVPHEPPYTLSKYADSRGREVDVHHALAMR